MGTETNGTGETVSSETQVQVNCLTEELISSTQTQQEQVEQVVTLAAQAEHLVQN